MQFKRSSSVKACLGKSVLFLMLLPGSIGAFSLIGPFEPWMDLTNGYRLPAIDIGGPMPLEQEYRWNVPLITYGFDKSFVEYFGSSGVAAVEQAFQILNDLPAASQMALNEFPTVAPKFNLSAYFNWFFDLKSVTLVLLLEQLGLAQPTRNAFVLRKWNDIFWERSQQSWWPPGIIPEYVLERNFDPSTLTPSPRVNETLLFGIVWAGGTNGSFPMWAEAYDAPVDALAPSLTAVADYQIANWQDYRGGRYFNTISRDDAGGIKYLLSTNNINLEILLPGIHGIGSNAATYVTLGHRPGVDKITFVRQHYSSSQQQWVPSTNQFTDRYMTNGVLMEQQLERVITTPDFLFRAKDVSNPWAVDYTRTGTDNWWNSATLSGNTNYGPGIIRPPVEIAFHKRGSIVQSGDDYAADLFESRWASFDSSTNNWVLYPTSSWEAQVKELPIKFLIVGDNDHVDFQHTWHVPAVIGDSAILQTSTNLTDWISLMTITNSGGVAHWYYYRLLPERYFRVLAQ
jgi:hypothetical protein